MGTNYYARIIPSKSKKEHLKKLIDEDDFYGIAAEVEIMYKSFRPYDMNDEPIGEIHLGKASGGWKFLWSPNVYVIRNGHYDTKHNIYIEDPDTAYYTYPLTKKGIKAFIDREDVEVYDEYGDKQDKDEFFKMALEWTTWKNDKTGKVEEAWDSESYHREHPNESIWICNSELTRLLEKEGFELSKVNKSDFYSDGLLFSTSNDFC